MDAKKLKEFLNELDCELTEDELAVISCLRDHLIDYLPESRKNTKFVSSVNSEINRVIDNYRLMAFEEALLHKRLDNKFKNNYNVEVPNKEDKQHMKKFNMNNTVKVKLSSNGAEVKNKLNSEANKFFEDRGITDIKKFKVDYVKGDIYEEQLWVIMKEFGTCLTIGSESPFIDSEIYFNDNNLKEVEDLK